jgi:MoaA/NifB/PqqE/SkfB family radical SAM enzyme
MGYPIGLVICPGAICNLRCVLCPIGQDSNLRSKGSMNFTLFKKIMDECGPFLYKLYLHNWGEPLLNKDIFRMVAYAKSFDIEVEISSNLNHFNDTICNELITSNLDILKVSLDGASQESIEKYQKGSRFENVIAHMRALVEQKRKLGSKHPNIIWLFLVHRYNEHEIEQARKIADSIGIDYLDINKFRCDMGTELFMKNSKQVESLKEWLPKQQSYSMYDYGKKEKKIILKDRCNWPL